MKLPSKIRFIDKNLLESFEKLRDLKGDEKKLYEFLVRAFEDIENNAFCGIQIPKKLIPKEYVKKYGVKNPWKCNFPNCLEIAIFGRS